MEAPDTKVASDEDWDSIPPVERAERSYLAKHRITFVLVFLPIIIGAVLARVRYAAAAGFAGAAVMWGVSAFYAIKANRHMFGTVRWTGFGSVSVSPSRRSPIGAKVVAAILFVLALGLVNVAVQVALATARAV